MPAKPKTFAVSRCQRASCPAHETLRLLAGKWKLILLWQIGEQPRRFNELVRINPGLSDRVLLVQLKELIRDDLVVRRDFHERPLRTEYSLTAKGRGLDDIFSALLRWRATW